MDDLLANLSAPLRMSVEYGKRLPCIGAHRKRVSSHRSWGLLHWAPFCICLWGEGTVFAAEFSQPIVI
jgi:hypothetical protein